MKTLHLLFVVSTIIFLGVIGEPNFMLTQTYHQAAGVKNLQLDTPKSDYVGGEIIPISGYTWQHLVINIFLVDSHGNIENSTQVRSNNTGDFNISLGIPSHVEGGAWSLFAKSGESNFATQIMVNAHGESPPPFNAPSGFAPLKQFKLGIELRYIQCNTGLSLIFKLEDRTPACVKPDTASVLVERGWTVDPHSLQEQLDSAKVCIGPNEACDKAHNANPIADLKNNTGIITLRNQTYYFETPNYTNDAYSHPVQISFHDVIFTLFPSGFRGGLPTSCGGTYYWTDAKFSDDTSELLHIFTGPKCPIPPLQTYFSNHTNPQAGLTFYDGKMKLLVSSSVNNSTGTQLPASFMPCNTPFVRKQSDVSPLFPNDTQITTSYNPVFFMPTNSTGYLCVHYTNENTPSQSSARIFEAQNLSKSADDIQIFPQLASVPTGSTNETFTIKSGNSGFYGIGFLCGGFPLAVGYDNNSKLVEGDFPWLNQAFMCPAITYSLDFVGTRGIGTHYIPTVTHSKIDYNITGTSVSSVHLTPTIQNITFTVNVRTFNDSSNFWFDIKDSEYVKFNGDPKLVEQSSDPCTWTFTNNNAVSDERQWYKMTGKVTVTDRPVTFPPHTNGTYSFSILAKNLEEGYYGLDPAFYGRPVDSNVPLENMGGGSIASYYPVVIGLDKYLDPSGICSR